MKAFKRLQTYGPKSYIYWISGIYKVVSYRKGRYHAYYIPDRYNNWGDHVSKPPYCDRDGSYWSTLKSAKGACKEHSAKHTPQPRTIDRSVEILAAYQAKHDANVGLDLYGNPI